MAVTELEQLEGRLPLLSNEASKLQAAISKLKLLQTLQGIENLQIGQHLKKNGKLPTSLCKILLRLINIQRCV
jgi:hypothetical protein